MANTTSMTQMSGLRRYVAVLRAPGVGGPAAGAGLASLPIGMLGLGVLLLMRQFGSGFAEAGLVVGLLGAGTGVGMAVQGRLIDRFGQPRVLLPVASLQLAAIVVLVVAIRGQAPTWANGGLALAAGLCEPQVGSSLRGLWPALVPAELGDTAHAVSSVLFAGPVLLGPLVLAGLLATGSATVAVLAAGGCFAGGAGLLARSRAARSWRPPPAPDRGPLGALSSPGVRIVTAVSAAQGLITGLLQVPAAAAATLQGAPGRAPLLYAALSAGGLLGTVGYGARRWAGSPARRLALLLGLVAVAGVGCAAAAAKLSLLPLGLFAVGLAIGPAGLCCYAVLQALTGREPGVEAFTAVTAAGVGAFAAGTAAAGLVVARAGPATAFLAAAAVAALAALLLAVRRRTVSGPWTT